MTAGSLKLRRTRGGGVNIRATGDVARDLVALVAGRTLASLQGRGLRVHFVDEGQDVLRWDVDAKGLIVDCGPYQQEVFIGGRVLRQPLPGEQLTFSFPGSREHRTCAWRVESVEVVS